MTPDGVINNYKKYLTNYGKGDKTIDQNKST